MGERAHLANPSIDLETHITDVLNVIHYEDLQDVVLLGHSYGGMVATGVAARAGDRIAQLIYLDAFVPRDGQSLFDLNQPMQESDARASPKTGDGWRVPPFPAPADTPAADVEWLIERRVATPIKCFEAKIKLQSEPAMPRCYIFATRVPPAGGREPGWRKCSSVALRLALELIFASKNLMRVATRRSVGHSIGWPAYRRAPEGRHAPAVAGFGEAPASTPHRVD